MAFFWTPPVHQDGNDCISPKDMRAWEKREIDTIPNRGRELMEIAGREVAMMALRHFPKTQEVLIFCGRGNNGGDGLVAAYYLSRAQRAVHLFVFDEAVSTTPDGQYMFERVRALPRSVIHTPADAGHILEWSKKHDILVIDAIFGIGYKPKHSALLTRVYQCIHQLACPVIAVDMPSGIDAATGFRGDISDEAPPSALAATETITFGAPKYGHFFGQGPQYCGKLFCVDIGLLPRSKKTPRCLVLSDEYCQTNLLPNTERAPDTHKGSCGHVLVIGGCDDMPGAPVMAARAALRAGCGLVTIATRATSLQTPDEIMRLSLVENGRPALQKLTPLLERADCVVIGPGLGRDDLTLDLLEICQNYSGRMILDADALWGLAQKSFSFGACEVFLTPHPGEAAFLTHSSARNVLFHPVETAQLIAAQYAAAVILKSHTTLIATRAARTQQQRFAINPYPNPAIATAGAGDVLSGILSGLLAQARCGAFSRWFDALEIASLAVHMHSKAGRVAASRRRQSVIASDIIEALGLNPNLDDNSNNDGAGRVE